MNNLEFWMKKKKYVKKYKEQENDMLKVYYMGGGITYEESNKIIIDPILIAEKIVSKEIDFNKLTGFFKMVIHNKKNNDVLFLGDNVLSQFFYVDYKINTFSDSFLTLKADRKDDFELDELGITQLLVLSRIITQNTIIEEIKKTNENCYYIYKDNKIIEYSKNLKDFKELPKTDLSKVVKNLMQATNKANISAVATGGTDSRAIIAHLIHSKIKPSLVITGYEDNPDIPVSLQVSNAVNCDLEIINPSIISEDIEDGKWLEKAFEFSDGVYDTVLSYRHYKKALWSMKNKYDYEFGGVGGEMYKNDYCMFVRNLLYFKKITTTVLYNTIIRNEFAEAIWMGELVKNNCKKTKNVLFNWVDTEKESGFLMRCNKVGYGILKRGFSDITNSYSFITTKIDPLMDRNLVASISSNSPMKHILYMYHRREIKKTMPILGNIKTDQGYSCSTNKISICYEFIKMGLFFLERVYARIKRKLGFTFKSKKAKYWDKDYALALDTQIFNKSFILCKEYGIINKDLEAKELPLKKIGIIIQIGMVLAK